MNNYKLQLKASILIVVLALAGSSANAQIGINTPSPKASLDVVSKPAAGYADGIIAPRLTGNALTIKTAASTYGPNQNAALVYVTDLTATTTNSGMSQVTKIGYYYWDNLAGMWQQMTTGTTAWKLGGNASTGTNNQLGTSDNTTLKIGTGSGAVKSFITGMQLTPNGSGAATVSTVKDMMVNGILVGNSTGDATNTIVGNGLNNVSAIGKYSTILGANIGQGGGLTSKGNTIVGNYACYFQDNAGFNTIMGLNAGQDNKGTGNIIIGVGAGTMNSSSAGVGTGGSHIFIGNYAGTNAGASTGIGNVVIGSLGGVKTDSNTVRIGSGGNSANDTYIAPTGKEYMVMIQGTTAGASPVACVGIGGQPVQGEALHVYGQISSPYSTITTSDKRLKTNIKNLPYGLKTLMQLRPVEYDKKTSLKASDYAIKNEMGFIAQELIKIVPDVVAVGKDKDQLMSVRYAELIPLLTKSIQEQQSTIEAQKKQIDELVKMVDELTKK